MKIKKNDNVIVLTGKDRGRTGTVLEAMPAIEKVLVEGINMKKRHLKGKPGDGQMVEVPSPINVSNVALVDPKTKKATRVGYKMEGDKKVRIAKKSGQTIK